MGHLALIFIAQPHCRRRLRPPDASSTILPRVCWGRSFSACPDPVSTRWAYCLGFVAQPSNPTVLWWTAANSMCKLRSWAATLHRLLSTTSSCFSCHHVARTRPRCPPGPSSRAYLSLHSSEAPQGIDLSRSLLTCTNANKATTYACNTRPRVSPHHVVNHSSQPGATIHWSSDAQVLRCGSRHPCIRRCCTSGTPTLVESEAFVLPFSPGSTLEWGLKAFCWRDPKWVWEAPPFSPGWYNQPWQKGWLPTSISSNDWCEPLVWVVLPTGAKGCPFSLRC
jgi:hypothetical protein